MIVSEDIVHGMYISQLAVIVIHCGSTYPPQARTLSLLEGNNVSVYAFRAVIILAAGANMRETGSNRSAEELRPPAIRTRLETGK
jgi:hypothetical protein